MGTLTLIKADDFERMAPLLGPCELVKGEIVQMAPSGMGHSEVTTNICWLLLTHVKRAKSGRVLTNEAGIVVAQDPDTVRGADVLYLSYQRLAKAEKWKGFLRHPPELVVEVFADDDSWQKMETKIAEYHAIGVDMVWVAEPKTQSVRLYPKGGEPYVLHSNATIEDKALPGFRCSVSEFFED